MSSKKAAAARAVAAAAAASASVGTPIPAFITLSRHGVCQIAVHVTPGARSDSLSWTPDGRGLDMRTTSPPVEGAANKDVVLQLASALSVPKSSLSVVAGLKSRDKVVATELASPDEIMQRLMKSVAVVADS